MICARAVHFAATLTAAGVAFFCVLIAEPALRKAGNDTRVPALVWNRLAWLAWISLAIAVISGAAWFLLAAAAISDRPLPEVFSDDVLLTVLLHTGFGRDWLDRFALACLLAMAFALLLPARRRKPVWIKAAAVLLAAALTGTLAWAGHAAGGLGLESVVHPAADVLHVVAAAAWVGMLVPLALLLAAVEDDQASLAIARTATVRFSALGIASVATLLATGAVNTWYLAGSVRALTATDYGRLLLAKIALFLAMVAIAAVNRLRLTPRLLRGASIAAGQEALRQLRRNALAEVLIGTVILGIVAVLGTQPPAIHQTRMSPAAPMNHHVH
jgi:copper resistance protein D